MEVKAKAKYLRIAPRKARLVVDVVRGMDAVQAVAQLQSMSKKASKLVLKLVNSAIANAENNFNLQKSNLYIKVITVDDGPTLHRWMPRAFGRATPIRKRTSHIVVLLDEKVPSKKIQKEKVKETSQKIEKTEDKSNEKNEEVKDVKKSSSVNSKKNFDKTSKNDKSFIKQMFRRKSGQ
jgi:large subunit ribosomal protein L22